MVILYYNNNNDDDDNNNNNDNPSPAPSPKREEKERGQTTEEGWRKWSSRRSSEMGIGGDGAGHQAVLSLSVGKK